jgi:hypothetical protein
MGPPTPPTTPLALQHDHIDTDFITGERNRDDNASTTITNLGAGSGRHPSHPTCSAGSLTLTEAAGTGLSEGPRVETDNTASCVAGQELRMRPSKRGVNIGGPMLSGRDCDTPDDEVFQPSDYEPGTDLETWFHGDQGVFPPDVFRIA